MRLAALLALLALDTFPLREEIAADLRAGEDVRMAADELLVQPRGDVGDVKRAFLVRELCMQRDLQQQIPKLIAQTRQVTRVEGL